MKKALNFLILFLCLLFYDYSFANLSDEEKIEIIRELAFPFFEEEVFYKWVSKKDRDNILLDGPITPEIYEYFMLFKGDFSLGGPGIYAYTSIEESLLEGDVLIQIEIETEQEHREIWMSKNTLKELEEKGVSLEDLYRLKSNVALRGFYKASDNIYKRIADDAKIIFKGEKGLKITPFTGKEVSLRDLSDLTIEKDLSEKQKEFFLDSIKEDIKERINRFIALLDPKKNISKEELDKKLSEISGYTLDSESLYIEPFVEVGTYLLILERDTPKKTLRKMVKYMMLRDNYKYVFHILNNMGGLEYLSESEKSKVVEIVINQLKPDNISNISFEFLRYHGGKHLSEKDISKIVDDIVIPKMVTVKDGLSFLQNTGHFLSETNVSKIVEKIVEKILPFSIGVNEGISLLKDASFGEYYMKFLREKAPTMKDMIKQIKQLESLENTGRLSSFEKKEKERLTNMIAIEMLQPGRLQRRQDENSGFGENYKLSPQDREKIINKMLELVQNEQELRSWPLFPEEHEKAVEKLKSSTCRGSFRGNRTDKD